MEGPPERNIENTITPFPAFMRVMANFISVLLHPLFIPLYATFFLMGSQPIQFADFSGRAKWAILLPVIENTIILPLAVVLLCKPLGFIGSVQLKTQKDRIIPYAATMIFYYWLFRVSTYHSADHEQFPALLCVFLLGNFISVILAFLANIALKVSLHALGMGAVLGVMIHLVNDPYFNVSVALIAAICLTGLVATARLILSAHRAREIYLGLLIGLIAQLMAVLFF
ncbi:MAG TPA: hypothetical protein VNE41_09600 [Chitinophagaceae bacterium]|nr:hypothetical protein [Chitinophagaceae bacterium]